MSDASRSALHIQTDLLPGNSAVSGTKRFLEKATKIFADRFSPSSIVEFDVNEGVAPGWGNNVKKELFRDMDMLESGHAREYLAEECLSPTQAATWTYTRVERTAKTSYRMYWNTDQFLLSAIQVGGNFYISQYENFPDSYDGDNLPSAHYCAVLRQHSDSNFKLYSCGCEGCDSGIGTFSCCNTSDGATVSDEGADRQLLADISHFTRVSSSVGSEMRCFSVVIPAIMQDRRSRVIWCPRVSRSVTTSHGTPRSALSRQLITSPSPVNRQHRFTFENPTGDRIRISSRLPVWCPEVNSLMLKFHGGRIREASSKNFMLVCDESPISNDTLDGTTDPSSIDAAGKQVLMQFGKFSKSKFSLDFRYPLAPIQAFAIGLSSCAWVSSSK